MKTERDPQLFKSAKRGGTSVATLCFLIHGDVRLMDNGNGAILTTDSARNIAKSEYANCLVEAITAAGGMDIGNMVVLWLPRK